MSAITVHFRGILFRCKLCGLTATNPSTLCVPVKDSESSDHHYSQNLVECYTRKVIEPRLIIVA